ncbi:MAG: glycoside hydrolase family 9 protein [Planctomycetota bacterium]|nr:glycoside hydrolase family 9 protein [Planctomycetota bacterium]
MNRTRDTIRTPALLLALALGLAPALRAADLREVLPVHDGILMVHFDEGHIDQGLEEKSARPYIVKLDIAAAAQPGNYSLSSEDDPEYKTPRNPTKVGRKAKSADTLSMFRPEKFVLDHWVYLVLPQPLRRGCSYTLRVTNLASNAPEQTFLFNEFTLRSESVHVSQIGFTPDAPKFAYLSHWMGDLGGADLDACAGKPFHLVAEDGALVFGGKVAKRKDTKSGAPLTTSPQDGTPWNGAKKAHTPKNFTGADVFECDFSAFKTPGVYRVAVEGVGCSFPFEIGAHAYHKAYYTASRGLFIQRAGIEKELEPGLNYPRDHHPDDGLAAFEYDKNWRWIDKPDHNAKIAPTGALKVWGWYHDAGDWDGYPGHVLVPLSLLLLYDLAPGNFADGQVGNRYKSNVDGSWYEEGKNGIPDLLDEASWLIQYYRRARALGLETGLCTGGVPGSYAGVDSCAGGASWKDTRALKFSAEDPAATYQYAACAAWLAACLDKAAQGAHPDSAGWVKEARAAWDWSKANLREGDEGKVRGVRMLAALCLYRVTKEPAYHEVFAADLKADPQFQRGEEGWAGPGWWELAAGVYGPLPADFLGLDAEFQKLVRGKVLEAAEREFVKTASQRGYRLGFDWNRTHNLGTFSSPILYQPAIAYTLTGDRKYLDAMHTSAAYFLGGNPMNMVWMTGLGQRSVRSPFHPDSWALIDYDSMVYDNEFLPGIVPYGSCDSVDFFGPGFHFSGDEDFSRSSAYPDVESWPLSETRFENRYSIAAGEFTVTQNTAPSIFAYGFLCARGGKAPEPNARPGVALAFPAEGAVLKAGGDVALRVKTTPDVRRVEYYRDARFLGASEAAPFAFTWRAAPEGEWLVTAVAYDAEGRISKPNDPAFDVDARVKLEAGAPEVPAEKLEILNSPARALKAGAVWDLAAGAAPSPPRARRCSGPPAIRRSRRSMPAGRSWLKRRARP